MGNFGRDCSYIQDKKQQKTRGAELRLRPVAVSLRRVEKVGAVKYVFCGGQTR